MYVEVVDNKNVMIKYGVLLGILSIVMSVLNYVTEAQTLAKTSLAFLFSAISLALTIFVIICAIKEIKKANGGFLTLGQAIKLGLGVALIAGIIVGVYTYIFTTYIEPEYTQQVIEAQLSKTLESNPQMSQEQLDSVREMSYKFTSPLMSFAFGIISSLFSGFIISLIAGAIMQKQKPQSV